MQIRKCMLLFRQTSFAKMSPSLGVHAMSAMFFVFHSNLVVVLKLEMRIFSGPFT